MTFQFFKFLIFPPVSFILAVPFFQSLSCCKVFQTSLSLIPSLSVYVNSIPPRYMCEVAFTPGFCREEVPGWDGNRYSVVWLALVFTSGQTIIPGPSFNASCQCSGISGFVQLIYDVATSSITSEKVWHRKLSM